MKTHNFLIVFFISSTFLFVGVLPSSFSESEKVEQIIINIQPPHEEFKDVSNEKDETNNENSNNSGSGNGPTSFVTGSNYALNGIPILINTPEGIRLNDQLTDQKDLEKLEQIHGEKFWERVDELTYDHYGLANAMFDPQTKNTFFVNGGKHSENTNSNFEYYVLERGYDPRDPSKVPNNLFTPTKYDIARAIMQKLDDPNTNDLNLTALNELNLELLSPHAFQMTDEQENIIYHQDIENRALSILQNSLPSISGASSSDGQNSQNGNLNQDNSPITSMPNSGSTSTQSSLTSPTLNDEIFQNTEHIKKLVSQDDFKPQYDTKDESVFPLIEILLIVSFFAFSLLIGLSIIKKFKNKKPLTEIQKEIIPTFDYVKETKILLGSALELYKSKQMKNAYERFSQSIRFYYSHHYVLNREVTTFEILEQIKKISSSEYQIIYDCLALCGVIEFAKHSEAENDFQKCFTSFEKILELTTETKSRPGVSL